MAEDGKLPPPPWSQAAQEEEARRAAESVKLRTPLKYFWQEGIPDNGSPDLRQYGLTPEDIQKSPAEGDFEDDLAGTPMPDLLNHSGLIGALTRHRFNTNAEYDDPIFCFAGALLGLSGIMGRTFQTKFESGFERTDTGQLYLAALASTGDGKADMPKSAEEIINYASRPPRESKCCIEVEYRDEVPSGPSLHSTLAMGSNQAVWFADELGMLLSNGSEHTKSAVRILMKLYGHYHLSAKDYSDVANRKPPVDGAFLVFGAATTPSTFKAALRGGDVTSGFLNRLIWFVVDRSPRQRPARSIHWAPWDRPIMEGLNRLLRWCADAIDAREPITVIVEKAAEDVYESEDQQTRIRPWAARKAAAGGPGAEMYQRVAENTKRLALVLAVSDAVMAQQQEPTAIRITRDHMLTAAIIVAKGVQGALATIRDNLQESDLDRCCQSILRAIDKLAESNGIASYTAVSRAVRANAGVRSLDLNSAWQELQKTKEIVILPAPSIPGKTGPRGKLVARVIKEV